MIQFLQLLANIDIDIDIDIDGFNMAIYCKNIVLQYYNFVNNNIVILFDELYYYFNYECVL